MQNHREVSIDDDLDSSLPYDLDVEQPDEIACSSQAPSSSSGKGVANWKKSNIHSSWGLCKSDTRYSKLETSPPNTFTIPFAKPGYVEDGKTEWEKTGKSKGP